VRILGADLPLLPDDREVEQTVVLLDEDGRASQVEHASSLPGVAACVGRLAGGEPFLLGVNVPVVVPAKPARSRPVENLLRRRMGFRLPPGGRGKSPGDARSAPGETLIAGLAAAGQPCLPYPDRDRRQPGLAETHPALTLRALLWESSPLASAPEQAGRDRLFRAYAPPTYHASQSRARTPWTERAAAMDLVLRALGSVEGYDLEPAAAALARAASERDLNRAAGILDAALCAGTARRYLERPEACVFLGDREQGYVIFPAEGPVRRIALGGAAAAKGRLFPERSLRERLGRRARLRPVDLLSVPGKPSRTEASFQEPPGYEFDNVDEMLWWKHCRHVSGVALPTEGLCELVVSLGEGDAGPLKLSRSRHATLSFRFEPPTVWRARVPTRDGRTYPFRVLRAVYETLAPSP
jgi:predicted RNase H-like nuclease